MKEGKEYPCLRSEKGLSFSDLRQDRDFITDCLDPKKRTFSSLKRDYSLSKDNSIKKACIEVRNHKKSIESIDENIKLVEPFLELMKQMNPGSFFYEFNVEKTTGVFKNLVFSLPGANHYYKNLKQILGLDGAHIKTMRVFLKIFILFLFTTFFKIFTTFLFTTHDLRVDLGPRWQWIDRMASSL